MAELCVLSDPAECREAWERVFPVEQLTDLWDVRACFHQEYRRVLHFCVVREGQEIVGLLPLCRIEESGTYAYFPGETWQGKTWIEQNRVLATRSDVLPQLLSLCPAPYHLRYLLPWSGVREHEAAVDETGYLFEPPRYGYSMERYTEQFSRKSAKRLLRDLAAFDDRGVNFRHDSLPDFDVMVRMSLDAYGERSYFADNRFRDGFRRLMALLHEKGWLRLTTVLVDGEAAAVDMGCIREGCYTLLAGGTHGGCRGIAKVINHHHMRRACEERLDSVDFLCGDFSWKTLFHLTPRPLYLLTNLPRDCAGMPKGASNDSGAVSGA